MAKRYILCLLLILSLLIQPSISTNFEGFDVEEFDEDLDEQILLPSTPPPNPTTTTATLINTESSNPTPPPPSRNPSSPSDPLLDFYDSDEFEGLPVTPSQNHEQVLVEHSSPSDMNVTSSTPPDPPSIRTYIVEIVCLIFLIMFIINYFTGKRQNENIAIAWLNSFAGTNSIFEKNFSLLGIGDGKDDAPLLLKEGQDVFKFYASGRRFCQGVLAKMELKCRHDLIGRAVDLVFRKKDTITFEVMMNEENMDHVVLAVARKKMTKVMLKEARDLGRFGSLMVSSVPGRKWVAEELAVVTESKEVAGDLINEAVLDQVLGEKAFEKVGKWFISLHFSDTYPASYRKILVFKFALPGKNEMAEMSKLVALVPYYIDLIGRYKLSSQARSKTESARLKLVQEAYKELQHARQEAIQRKKLEKKKATEEAETKLGAEALRKREEKERARQLKKSGPRVKMLR